MNDFARGFFVGLIVGLIVAGLLCAESARSQSNPYYQNPTSGYEQRTSPMPYTPPSYLTPTPEPSYNYGGKPC